MPAVQRIAVYLAAALALAGCSHATGANATETLSRTFALEEGGTVSVKNTNGSVRVSVGDGDQVLLRARKSARTADDLAAISVHIDASPRLVEIETEIQRNTRNASVNYELTVPRTAAVRARSVNGSVDVEGSAGGTRAETVNGRLSISNAEGDVSAKTVNGSVDAHWSRLNGSVKNSFETVNGSLRVRMPADANGSFSAKTVNGSIKTDLPLEVQKSKRGRRPSINDSIGTGGPSFALSTVNGSIRILAN